MKGTWGSSAQAATNNSGADSVVDPIVEHVKRTQLFSILDSDGNVLEINDHFLDALEGFGPQVTGEHITRLIELDATEFEAVWAKMRAGTASIDDYRLAAAKTDHTGDERWVKATFAPKLDDAGNLLSVAVFGPDVSGWRTRLRRGERIEAAISKSQALIEFKTDGTIVDANENFCGALQYDLSEIVGQHHRMFVSEEERNGAEYAAFWERLAQGHFEGGEYLRIAKDGSHIWIQATYNPILDSRGNVLGVIKFASDITAANLAAADSAGHIDAI